VTKRLVMLAICLAVASPVFAQKKEEERLSNAATAMQAILSENNGLPKNILDQADCVLIFPSVKKSGHRHRRQLRPWCAHLPHGRKDEW